MAGAVRVAGGQRVGRTGRTAETALRCFTVLADNLERQSAEDSMSLCISSPWPGRRARRYRFPPGRPGRNML